MNPAPAALRSWAAARRLLSTALVGGALVVGLTACATPAASSTAATASSTKSAASGGMSTAPVTSGTSRTSAAPSAGTATATPPASQGLTATGTAPALPSSLASGAAHHNVSVDGENFGLKVDYWTTVPVTKWSVLGPADLHVAAYLAPKTATVPEVLVDRFTVSWRLDALTPGLNGVELGQTVDAPDNAIPGFELTKTVSYSTQSDRSGATTTLFDRWNQLAAGQPINAAALVKAGAYGITVQLRYDLLVQSAGDKNWHRRTVVDQLSAPLTAA